MRKIYSLLLALFLIPLMSVAANQAISKDARTNSTTKTDSRAYVQPDVIRPADGNTSPSYTIASWVKLGKYSAISSSTNNMVIMGYGGRENCNDNGSWNLIVNNGALSVNGWGGFATTLTGTVSTGKWHYMAVVYDKRTAQMSVYLDGTLAGTKYYGGEGTGPDWFTNENPAIYFGGYCFNGQIDEVQIWNKALTADEVTAAMTYAPAVDGLVGFYTFDQGTTATGTFANESTQAVASTEPLYFENVEGSVAWKNGLAYVISQGSYTLTNPSLVESDREVASADPVEVNIFGDYFGEGRVTLSAANGETTYAEQEDPHMITPGTTLTLTATPAEGYALAGYVELAEGAEKYFTENTYTVSIGGVELYAYAVSEAGLWDMTVVNEANIPFTMVDPWGRNVASNLTDLYGAGDAVVYKLTLGDVPSAYDPATVVVTLGEDVIDAVDGVYEIASAGDATLTITAQEKAKYTVTIEQPAQGGTVSVTTGSGTSLTTINSGDQVPAGTVLNLDKTAASGFQFVGFVVNGVSTVESTVTVNENVTISAEFEEGIDYCQPTGVDGRYRADNETRVTGREITSIAVTDGTNSVTVQGAAASSSGRAIVYDRTSTILSTAAGKTITTTSTGTGSWMNTFIYVDWNLDGFTTADRVFSNFTGDSQNYAISANFSVPADQAPGNYRVRYIVDWENTDPCKYGQAMESWYSKYNDNGEYVIDFIIRVESEDYDTPRTITVAAANDAHGTVAITDPATDGNEVSTVQKAVTIKATPAEGYAFLNWTDGDGNVVATTATYTYTGAEDAAFTANFGYTLNYTVGENGSASFMVGTESVSTGTVLAPGTEVTVVATPNTGKFAQVLVNGAALELTENAGSFTMEEATTVAVSFVDAIYTLTINKIGDGEVIVSDNGTKITGPTGNEYTTGSVITNISLRVFAKPAEGGELVSVSFEDEGGSSRSLTMNAVTAEGWEGWYFGGTAKPTGNRVLTIEFTALQGIDEIGIDAANGPVEYYNLQGVRVGAENLVPGFYIIRQGEKAAKVFINK